MVLRGTYQTVPISIFGIGLDQAAEAYVPRPAAAPLPLEAAVQRFPKLMARIHDPIKEPKHGGEGREIPGSGPSDGIRYDRDARPTLKALARAAPPSSSKGTLRTRIAAFSSLEPQVAAVEKAADAICAKLAAGEGVLDSGTSSRVDDHLIDLILEWCSLLADTGSPISAAPSVLQCGALGLAAAVLLCTHRPSALSFLQRHGTLLLADVLRMPKAPGSFLRHATAACLLLAHNCGALGCEALLGWWRPAFVQWRTVKKVDRPAAGESAREGGKAKRSARERSPSTAGKDAIIPQVDGAHDDADNGDGGKRKKSKRGGKRKHKEIVWENPADLLPPDAIPAGADADDRWGMDVPEALEDTDALRGDRYDHGHGGSSRRDREKSSKDGRRKRDNEGAREKERRRRERSRSRSPARGHRDGENKERRREKERERSRERRKKEERDRGVAAREAAGEKSSKRHRTPTPPPALPVPTPQEESEDAFHKHLSTKYWDARLKEYAGIYSALSAVLIELCPRPLASIGSCLLRVLRFYERAANFSVTVEEIVRRQGGGGKGKMLPREATEAVSACAEGLAAMAEMLAAGPMPSLLGKKATTPGLLPVPHEPHPLLLELLEARSVLLHLPAVLLVPGTYATESDPQAAAAAAAMLNQLALGCKPFIAVLTSSLAGLKALAAAPDAFEQLALALQDASADSPAFLQSAAAVSNTALAALALEDFCSAAVDSQQFAAAVSSLQKLLTSGHESTQCLLFVAALQSWEVLPRCLHLIQAQAWLQKEAAGLKTTVNGKLCTFEALLDAAPLLSIGADLLSALTGEWHASIVARWAPAAADLVAPLAAEVHALYSCGTPEATALCSKLGHIHGCLEALAAYALEGIAGALPLLDEVLPMLDVDSISTGKWQSSTGASGVAWPAVREFWDDPSRRGKAMAGLRLMCTGLWQPDGRAAAVAIDHAGGLQLLHRAVATAAEAVAAAQTDRQWVSRAGAAIEPAASYVGKRLAVEFLEAAAAAASGLMQHLRSMVSVANEPLAMALVESHAVLSVDEECLLHSMGVEAGADAAVQPPSPALAARCHLTSALRCWIEASDWSPPLLKLVLQGPQRAKQQKNGVKAVAPRQLFTATCLLGDLMPEEWPLPGRRSDQPPPSARKYRLALATVRFDGILLCMLHHSRLVLLCMSASQMESQKLLQNLTRFSFLFTGRQLRVARHRLSSFFPPASPLSQSSFGPRLCVCSPGLLGSGVAWAPSLSRPCNWPSRRWAPPQSRRTTPKSCWKWWFLWCTGRH